jgi:hypothetical protein
MLISIKILSSNSAQKSPPSPAQVATKTTQIPSPLQKPATVHREIFPATPPPLRLPTATSRSIAIQCEPPLNLNSPEGFLIFIKELFSLNPQCSLLKLQSARIGTMVQLLLHRYDSQKMNKTNYEFGQGQTAKFESDNPGNVSIFVLLAKKNAVQKTSPSSFPETFDEELKDIIQSSPVSIATDLKKQFEEIITGQQTGTIVRTLNGLLQYFP